MIWKKWVRYLRVEELPPRPDPRTGQPLPPPAPWYINSGEPCDPGDRPAASPPGQSPILAWYQPSQRTAVTAALGCAALGLGVIVATRSLDTLRIPWVWLIAALVGAAFYRAQRAGKYSAGADWLANRRSWVRLYELTKVTARASHDPTLRLTDAAGRTVKVKLFDLQSNWLLWDLVYNGILHSVIAGGARTNTYLHQLLNLPYLATDQTPGHATDDPSADRPVDPR